MKRKNARTVAADDVFSLAYQALRKDLAIARDIIKRELEKKENKKLRKRLLRKLGGHG